MNKNIEQFPRKTTLTPQQKLEQLMEQHKTVHLTELFDKEQDRFAKYCVGCEDLVFDFSKQRINQPILDALVQLAESKQLNKWIDTLFSQNKINYTEQREAMHWALRLPADNQVYPELAKQVSDQLERMYQLVNKIHEGQYRGATGEVIQDVVNIGVGGSDLGPLMVSHALSDFKVKTAKPLNIRFVSTMDGSQLSDILHQLRPETTLFIVSSKSFSTIDTLSNAHTARKWLEKALGRESSILKSHFIGVSTKPDKMTEWGIHPDNQFLLWDWVGGRYSLWSCIGLPIALTIGVEGFKAFLAGAHGIDEHFRTTEFHQNIPVLMGLMGIWNTNYLNLKTHAVLPYDGRLKYFTSYLQQLEMESNGKSTQRNGQKVENTTCPIVWGEVGPNAQHAFYQLLHQGTQKVSCDFIAPMHRYNANHFTYVENADALIDQHLLALSNCLAQSRLLAFGNDALKVDQREQLPAYKQYEGNQPSTTMLLKELSPRTMGKLIALYEHKVFVQSVIWDINPFDQWGVEKGKEIANDLLPILNGESSDLSHLDDSTQGLIQFLLGKSNG
ncbi:MULTISPECIES: glucose-6-phosphate isomerase [Acinetobacter]|uniref:Glucose-6-phosphate isomerase n=2 Tax=Acinetobacter baylyi TaxID=202950 RepID=G6PI_ACIAD|nr:MULTISPECIES: glucose-6-phosphate isomerase [Acinetobacter]Q59088.1 RecName: Full=Glucose-6-phosphate isomerase; Short=GPI; AltName: Full=Phosphoglucose isomerase; Short=PGI; AltName: Full=Phosphohexose isomerase; Short=PHI [Acinetobacter baylyi ADP1]CAA61993.1 glucose-6-phosphate isomerase [Acinetobacter calcoaceticus]ENV53048.1 glucose-6-phosphate isomerase [Acinetobacter baylyi DSM 14961 = CIP 107474]KAF2372020.1 glucose-6-phosphate isomerase [Acinetobacter baylyi]KAF2372306.1 glucose-6-